MMTPALRCDLAGRLLLLLAVVAGGCAQPEPTDAPPAREWVEVASSDYGAEWTLRAAGVEGGSGLLRASPGTTWSVDVELRLAMASHVPAMGRFKTLLVAVFGEMRHDASGAYRPSSSDYQLSHVFTTTGVPIDTADHWPLLRSLHGSRGSPFEGFARFPLTGDEDLSDEHVFRGRIDVALPDDLEPGYWEPFVALLVEVEGVAAPVFLDMFEVPRKEAWFPALPLVEVGHVAPPRIPWTAFPDDGKGIRGVLPDDVRGQIGQIVRGGFPKDLVLRPGTYNVGPGLPTVFPRQALPLISEILTAFPAVVPAYWQLDRGEVTCTIEGPGGLVDLGNRRTSGVTDTSLTDGLEKTLAIEGGPLRADLRRTGVYRVRFGGFLPDRFGRRFAGGGEYTVHVAHPLTFSTSCKPGTNFLVGDRYPTKVNVNPPLPADVDVLVDYFPQSDPARKTTWRARGRANRFGHFVAYDTAPLAFAEPGEYLSRVTSTYVDEQGDLWMGTQTSSGVVAPVTPSTIRLHGNQTWRDGRHATTRPSDDPRTFEDAVHQAHSFLPSVSPGLAQVVDPPLPYHDRDTLFVSSRLPLSVEIEARFSLAVTDERIAAILRRASAIPARPLPRRNVKPGAWTYVENILERGYGWQSLLWSPIPPDLNVELPVEWASRGDLHPVNFQRDLLLEAYTYFGAVRPGLPVLLGVVTKDGHASHWQSDRNTFANRTNAGHTGDRPGDIYRFQAGVVLKDRETGTNHYDAYSSVISFVASPDTTYSVLPAGARPLAEEGGRRHFLFLATDTHDCLEVGEVLGVGGMVFPNVPADVTWTVTPPDGDAVEIRARANRLGIVAGDRRVPVDRPGLYRVRVRVAHEGLVGGIVGTNDGDYWVCAVDRVPPKLLGCSLPPASLIAPEGEAHVALTWPRELENVRVHYAAITPGRVLEQGVAEVAGDTWTYRFSPLEAVAMVPNYDAVSFENGDVVARPAETVVFQFVLEGEDAQGKHWDALRVVLRGRMLLNASAGVSPRAHIPTATENAHRRGNPDATQSR